MDVVQFAERKLNEGQYSDAFLAIVDAEPKTWSEVSPHLEMALEEFGVVVPPFDKAIWMILEFHIRLIVTERVDPIAQFRSLLDDITNFELDKNITEYVGDNVGIESMYGGYYCDNSSEQEVSQTILSESKKWLRIHSNH